MISMPHKVSELTTVRS